MVTTPNVSAFSAGGAHHIEPIKDVRPKDARNRASGPPPPRKPDGFFASWGKRIFYSIFAIFVIGLVIWAFTYRPDTRPQAVKDATATSEAREGIES